VCAPTPACGLQVDDLHVPSMTVRIRRSDSSTDRGHTPRLRPMISFMISVVPPKIVWIRTSW
jgi:hypothetical protein